jgi:YVTN family beta-propeller protein
MRHRMTSRMVMVMCVLVLAACGSSTGQAGGPTVTPSPTPVPSAGTVSATISGLGASDQSGYEITGDDMAVWVYNGGSGNLFRIDPKTNTLVATIPVGSGGRGMALGQGAVWVVNPSEGTLSQIDPQTKKVVATIPVGLATDALSILTVSPGAVWVSDFARDSVIRLDPQTHQVVATIPNVPGTTGLSFGAGSVWACNHHSDTQGLVRLDPQTNQIQAQINPAGNLGFCFNVVALAQAVWTTSFFNGEPTSSLVERIDPVTNTVKATIPVAILPHPLAADAHGAWVIDPAVGLYRIDPTTNRLAGLLPTTGLEEVSVGAGSVWVVKGDGTLLRITPAA